LFANDYINWYTLKAQEKSRANIEEAKTLEGMGPELAKRREPAHGTMIFS
jgi:hypothetical protein